MTGSKSMGRGELDARVHDAFEAMGPSAEVRKRVFANLQANAPIANNERAEGGPQIMDGGSPRRRARLRVWHIALPAAACVALLAVLVGVNLGRTASVSSGALPLGQQEESQQDALANSESAKSDAAAELDEEAMESDAEASFASDDAATLGAVPPELGAAPYEEVTLLSGETYMVGERMAAAPSYEELEEATVRVDDDGTTEACVVADKQFVRFKGDESWYRLVVE